jgi:hypothetical protein
MTAMDLDASDPGVMLRKRGTPKGNRNALKHGFKSGKRREFDSGLRQFRRRLHAMCALAHAIAQAKCGGTR